MIRKLPAILFLVAFLLVPGVATAHVERPAVFPEAPGEVPAFRKGGPTLLVCKRKATLRKIQKLPNKAERRNERLYEECREDGYRHIQAAVDHVTKQGSRIMILPGTYRERPSAGPPPAECAGLEGQRPLSYEDQRRCPGVDNLISIFGDSEDHDFACDLPVCHLQIQGTGNSPDDVVVDNGFAKLNGIRADRTDGIYFRNFMVQNSEFNAIYVIEADGFVIDRMIGRWNDEYGFLTFADDHGFYTDCEAYGNGDSGIYPGAPANI
ncbi:MAG: right-handed parallel beta-helix repeat-containing protein, partial [Actinomycetota bacterium]